VALTDDAIAKIKSMIVSGELKPGDRLPVEKILAQRLGLSRNSLREAIRALSVLRVLETRQGAGTYVTSLAPGLVLEAVSFIVNFHDTHTALQFLDVRRVLEAEAAARASLHINDDDIAGLRAANAEMRDIADRETLDNEKLLEVDRRFHSMIAEKSGNPALAALVDMLGGQTQPARILRVATHREVAGRAADEHEDIVNALAQNDPDRARLRAATHVLSLENWLESVSLDRQES
jgi:DNA-binding FadR family transcriptional regulator